MNTLIEMHAYFNEQLVQARNKYERKMIQSTVCLRGIQTLAQKTQNLILMDRKQLLLAEELKSSKMIIEDNRKYQLKLLKRRQHQSPWFNSDFRSF